MRHPVPALHWLALVILLLSPTLLWASVGKVVIAKGEVFALDSSEQRRPLKRRSEIFAGDTLVTGADGALQIRFNDNAIMALREESRLLISEYHQRDAENDSDRILMDLLGGGFRTITGSIGRSDEDAYQVRTPNASIGIRGTHYEAVMTPTDSLLLGVYDGSIAVSNNAGTIDLGRDDQFLFARVEPNARPQGLLDPPEELNTPLSPNTEESGATQPEDEPDAELNQEDTAATSVEEGLDADSGTEPPIVPETEDTIDDLALIEPTTPTMVEEELDDDPTQGESTDQRLTQTQIDQLSANPPRTGFVVVSDDGSAEVKTSHGTESYSPVHFGYLADGDNGPIFANFESELLTELDSGYKTPDVVFKGPTNTPLDIVATHVVGDSTVEWGIWNASPEDTAKLYTDPDSSDFQEEFSSSYFFVEATAAKTADLIGQRSFSLNCTSVEPCMVASRPVYTIEASGNLSVDFSDGSGAGNLWFQATNATNTAMNDDWRIDFEGQVQGSQFFSSVTAESIVYVQGEPYELAGNVDGLFTGPDTDLHFVGGFGVHSVNFDHEINGVFIMEEAN